MPPSRCSHCDSLVSGRCPCRTSRPSPDPPIGAVIHDFHERLAFSATLSDEPSWIDMYRDAWPDMVSAVRLDRDSEWQRDGIDRVVFLPNGRQILVDEKKRNKRDKQGRPYLDVLLEEWSVFRGEVDHRNKIGWALDRRKRCDFIAYAIPLAHRCYLLPFELTRLAFTAHRSDWSRTFGVRDAPNAGYMTRNVPVPLETLQAAIGKQMQRSFCHASDLELPRSFSVKDQLTFQWGIPREPGEEG